MSSAQPVSFTNDDSNIAIQAGQFIAHGPTNVVQQTQDALSQLPRAADASFNSLAKQHEPTCLENTRTDLLERIHSWVEGLNERHIFWLCGLAGTGKSTLARTVARHYHDQQRLAASFFFSRGGGDTGHARQFVTTIAVQLAENVPALKQYVSRAVLQQRDIANQALRDQWRGLVHDPLSKLHDKPTTFVLVVVEALDECNDRQDILVIIQLLASAQSYPGVRLRFLLTSRPEGAIQQEFSKLSVERHRILPADDGDDVGLFLKETLGEIAQNSRQPTGWPGENTIEQLCQRASGLFIWAATVCRYISRDEKRGFVQSRLETILQNSSPDSGPERQLDQIYNTVLDSSVSKVDEIYKDDFRSQLRHVLGTIVVLVSPLSVSSLGQLFGSGNVVPEDELDGVLEDLHAILDIPSDRRLPLRLHHPSFRDFLLHESRCREGFRVEEKSANSLLWKSCIQLMSNSLKLNICEVKRHGTLVAEVDIKKIEQHLPLELQYACSYWIQHLAKSGDQLSDHDQVHKFIQEHCLHWLEVLGWIGKVPEGVHSIISLESMIVTSNCPQLYAVVHDMKRFALYNRSAIEQAPLQVYCSGLVFAPNSSIIKCQFEDKMPRWITRRPHVDSNWSALLQTLEGHSRGINVVAFSPNGEVLASGSDDATIKLWDVGTGAALQTLKGHSSKTSRLAFTPCDSEVLASASDDKTVKLWNVGTGELIWNVGTDELQPPFSSLSGWASALTFSSDHKVLALVLQHTTVELWDMQSKERQQVRDYGQKRVHDVVFSRDGTALALVSDFGTFRLMDVDKNVEVYAVESEGEGRVAVSSHGEIMASVLKRENLKLRHMNTDTPIRIWKDRSIISVSKGHSHEIRLVALSPNGTLLASVSRDETVKLWDTGTGKLVQTFKGYSFFNNAMAFAPDNKALGFISTNAVKLWKLDTGAVVHTLKGHSGHVRTVAFSPNSNVLASGSDDNTIKIWEASTEGLPKALQGRSRGVKEMVFSPDGKMLASVTGDRIGRDWMVKLWNTETGQVSHTLNGHSDGVHAVAFSYDSKRLASASHDLTIKIWNTSSGTCLQTLVGHERYISSVAFSYLSTRLVSASGDYTVKIWDVRSGSCQKTLIGHWDWVRTAVFSPNNDMLASASDDGTVILWNVYTGEIIYRFRGHSQHIWAIAFSPNGKMLASTSRDKTVRLWDLDTRQLVWELQGHSDDVVAVTFSPNGTVLASASEDKIVKLWDVHQGKLWKNYPVEVDVTTLSFSQDADFLYTNRGLISTGLSIPFFPPQTPLPDIFVGEQWIYYQGSRRLWLPPEYRATYVAVHGRTVALGHTSGRVSLLEIAF
ncbi:hypothetical protein ACJQWK_03400 [Exserohilum turcicum]|uniref:Mitochondrial division protein 1 n=1 Tax=Exserohilum turcicum (strain 28A) TaxID=671987 RepID=R0KGF6_EXST2|nr:uncharacterized protein SETTUDRAFT_40847 [Exserohilum turcica Et28A]EOA91948.1 hypothetical protein SETTUDRAFT_40847 [Exserohilum turcica Et28A]